MVKGTIKDPKDEGSLKDKFSDTFENIKKHEKIEDLYRFAQSNTGDTIAYVAMVLGILILFFNPLYGGLLIGVVFGLYFSKEIAIPVRNLEEFIEEMGMVKSLILGGLLLGLFIEAFPSWIMIGAAVTVGIKQLIVPDTIDKVK